MENFGGPELNSDQTQALKILEGPGNVFLTGKAGTGKSFLIRHFQKTLGSKKMPVVASTGAAAVLVRGRTFHSFFGLGILAAGVHKTVEKAVRSKKIQKRLESIDGVIIDEVSMLSGILLSAAEQVARKIRGSSTPWGGLKIITVGDFFQLPPVTPWGQSRDWAFLHPVWTESEFETVSLSEVMRTQDLEFLSALNDVRMASISSKTEAYFRSKVVGDPGDEFVGTRLYPRKIQADQFNEKKLKELPGEVSEFATHYIGSEVDVERAKPYFSFPEELTLKEGAFVMLTQNDPAWQWHNGTTGHIVSLSPESIVVKKLSGVEVTVMPITQDYLDPNGEVLVSATNFPIRLGYAVTIHKAQGMSIDRLRTDVSGSWEHGQVYVALSRSNDPQGLSLANWRGSAVRVDPQVRDFYSSF